MLITPSPAARRRPLLRQPARAPCTRAVWASAAAACGLVAYTLVTAAPARAQAPDRWLGRDKALHFGVSAALAGGGYAATAALTPAERPRLWVGGGVALGAGVVKEIADRYTGGTPSWRDLGWDALGTATGLAVAWLLDRYLP